RNGGLYGARTVSMYFSSLHVQLFQDVDHFERAQCSLCTLVTRLGTGSLDGLFNVFCSQYAEGNRNFIFHHYLGQALAVLARHQLEVVGATTDDGAQRDYGVVL